MNDDSLKGRLDVGDRVHLAWQTTDQIKTLLADLEDSLVLAVNGSTLLLLSKNGSLEVEMHRKYFCSAAYIGHPANPCPFCGYEEPDRGVI